MERTLEERINDLTQESRELSDLTKEVIAAGKQLEKELKQECQVLRDGSDPDHAIPFQYRRNTGKGVDLYYVGDDTFVRLDDVLELISTMKYKYKEGTEKGYINSNREGRIAAFVALNHLQTKLYQNETDKTETIEERKKVIEKHSGKNRKKKPTVPGRYAVGKRYDGDYYMFYTGDQDGIPMFSNRPCVAKCYMAYRDASAVADFLDDSDWEVLDMFEALSPEQRLNRGIFGEIDWDEGNENAVRLHFEPEQ